MPSIRRTANGGLRKNAGDLTPELAKKIVAAVRRTPLSLRSAAYAVGMQPTDLRYIIHRGAVPGADPLWEDTSVRCRELIAAAEAKNYARLQRAANGGTFEEVKTEDDPITGGEKVTKTVKLVPANVAAQAEIQRQAEKDVWQIDATQDDAPAAYMDLFSRPTALPQEILHALLANGWTHPALLGAPQATARELAPAPESVDRSIPDAELEP